MTSTWPEQEHRLVQYLLGLLPPEEESQLEDRRMDDDALQEALLAAADDLIHAYLAGRLSADGARRFEARFLASPQGRERLRFMRLLVTTIDRRRVPRDLRASGRPAPAVSGTPAREHRSPRYRRALAAAAVFATASLLAAVLLRDSGRGVPQAVRPQPSAPVSPDLVRGVPAVGRRGAAKSPSPSRVQLVRIPRAPATPIEVALTPETQGVRLEIPVPGDEGTYNVTLRTDRGSRVWRALGLAASARARLLTVTVPAALLGAGDFVLSVEGETVRDAAVRSPSSTRYLLKIVR